MDFDIKGSLFPNPTTLIVQLLATAILVFFFVKFLWKPMVAFMTKRALYIEGNINEAKELNEKAKIHIKKSQQLARDGALEYKDIVERAKEDGQKVKASLVEEGKKEAENKILQANHRIESEKQKAQDDMKQEIVDIALEAAKQIIGKEIDENSNRKLVKDFINEVEINE